MFCVERTKSVRRLSNYNKKIPLLIDVDYVVRSYSFIKLYACISKIYNVIFPFFWKYLCKNAWLVYLLQIKEGGIL